MAGRKSSLPNVTAAMAAPSPAFSWKLADEQPASNEDEDDDEPRLMIDTDEEEDEEEDDADDFYRPFGKGGRLPMDGLMKFPPGFEKAIQDVQNDPSIFDPKSEISIYTPLSKLQELVRKPFPGAFPGRPSLLPPNTKISVASAGGSQDCDSTWKPNLNPRLLAPDLEAFCVMPLATSNFKPSKSRSKTTSNDVQLPRPPQLTSAPGVQTHVHCDPIGLSAAGTTVVPRQSDAAIPKAYSGQPPPSSSKSKPPKARCQSTVNRGEPPIPHPPQLTSAPGVSPGDARLPSTASPPPLQKRPLKIDYVLNRLRTAARDEERMQQLRRMQQIKSAELEEFCEFQAYLKARLKAQNLDISPVPPPGTGRNARNKFSVRPPLPPPSVSFVPTTNFQPKPGLPFGHSTPPDFASSLSLPPALARAMPLPPELTVIPKDNGVTLNLPRRFHRRSPPPMVPIENLANLRKPLNEDSVVHRLKRLGTDIELERRSPMEEEVEFPPAPLYGHGGGDEEDDDDEPLPIAVDCVLSTEPIVTIDERPDDVITLKSFSPEPSPTRRPNSVVLTRVPPPPSLIPISCSTANPVTSRWVPILPHPSKPLQIRNIQVNRATATATGGPSKRKRKEPKLSSKSEIARLAHALVQPAGAARQIGGGRGGNVNYSFSVDEYMERLKEQHMATIEKKPKAAAAELTQTETLPQVQKVVETVAEVVPESAPKETPVDEQSNEEVAQLPEPKSSAPTEPMPQPAAEPVPAAEPPLASRPERRVFVFSPEEATLPSELPGGRKLFACDICSGVYCKMYSLKKHYFRYHVNPRMASERDALKFGLEIVATEAGAEDEGMFRCNECDKIFVERQELKSHLLDHPPVASAEGGRRAVDRYACEHCAQVFRKKKLFTRHRLEECVAAAPRSPPRPSEAELAAGPSSPAESTAPPSPAGEKAELVDDAAPAVEPVEEPTERQNDEAEGKKETSSLGISRMCLFCELTFTNTTARKRHVLQNHHPKRKQQVCSYCKNKKFSDLRDLLKHICEAHSKRYFGCAICKIRFKTKDDLTEHNAESHPELQVVEKPAPVDEKTQVKQAAATAEPVTVINKNGSKGHRCSKCAKTFGTTNELKRHRKKAHSETKTNGGKVTAGTASVAADGYEPKYRNALVPSADYETQFFMKVSQNVGFNVDICMDGRIDANKTSDLRNATRSSVAVSMRSDRPSESELTFQDMYGTGNMNGRFIRNVSRLHLATQLSMLRKANLLDKDPACENSLSSAHRNTTTMANELALKEKPGSQSSADKSMTDDAADILFSGEWIRSKKYICAACFARFNNFWDMEDHRWIKHPNVWGFYYEFVTDQAPGSNWAMKRSLQSSGALGRLHENSSLPVGSSTCSKCQKVVSPASEFHKHILECGGDTTWVSTMFAASSMKRHKKWRPYGSRRRRNIARVRGLKRNIPTTPIKILGMPRNRQKAGDSETIQKMIANLPPKRITRRIIQFDDIDSKNPNRANSDANILTRKRREKLDAKMSAQIAKTFSADEFAPVKSSGAKKKKEKPASSKSSNPADNLPVVDATLPKKTKSSTKSKPIKTEPVELAGPESVPDSSPSVSDTENSFKDTGSSTASDTVSDTKVSSPASPPVEVYVEPKKEEEEEDDERETDLETVEPADTDSPSLPDSAVILAAMRETMRQTDAVIPNQTFTAAKKRKRDDAKCKKCDVKQENDAVVGSSPCDSCIDPPTKREAVEPPAKREAVDLPAKSEAVERPDKLEAVEPPAKREAVEPPANREAVEPPAKRETVGPPAKRDAIEPLVEREVVKPLANRETVETVIAKCDENQDPTPVVADGDSRETRSRRSVVSKSKDATASEVSPKQVCRSVSPKPAKSSVESGKTDPLPPAVMVIAPAAEKSLVTSSTEEVLATAVKMETETTSSVPKSTCKVCRQEATSVVCRNCAAVSRKHKICARCSQRWEDPDKTSIPVCLKCQNGWYHFESEWQTQQCRVCFRLSPAVVCDTCTTLALQHRLCARCNRRWDDLSNSGIPVCLPCQKQWYPMETNVAGIAIVTLNDNSDPEKCGDCTTLQTSEMTLRKLCDPCSITPKPAVIGVPSAAGSRIMPIALSKMVRNSADESPEKPGGSPSKKNVILICKGCYGLFDTVSSYKQHCETCQARVTCLDMDKKPLLGFAKRNAKGGVEIAPADTNCPSFEIIEGVQIKSSDEVPDNAKIESSTASDGILPIVMQHGSDLAATAGTAAAGSAAKRCELSRSPKVKRSYASDESICSTIESVIKSVCYDRIENAAAATMLVIKSEPSLEPSSTSACKTSVLPDESVDSQTMCTNFDRVKTAMESSLVTANSASPSQEVLFAKSEPSASEEEVEVPAKKSRKKTSKKSSLESSLDTSSSQEVSMMVKCEPSTSASEELSPVAAATTATATRKKKLSRKSSARANATRTTRSRVKVAAEKKSSAGRQGDHQEPKSNKTMAKKRKAEDDASSEVPVKSATPTEMVPRASRPRRRPPVESTVRILRSRVRVDVTGDRVVPEEESKAETESAKSESESSSKTDSVAKAKKVKEEKKEPKAHVTDTADKTDETDENDSDDEATSEGETASSSRHKSDSPRRSRTPPQTIDPNNDLGFSVLKIGDKPVSRRNSRARAIDESPSSSTSSLSVQPKNETDPSERKLRKRNCETDVNCDRTCVEEPATAPSDEPKNAVDGTATPSSQSRERDFLDAVSSSLMPISCEEQENIDTFSLDSAAADGYESNGLQYFDKSQDRNSSSSSWYSEYMSLNSLVDEQSLGSIINSVHALLTRPEVVMSCGDEDKRIEALQQDVMMMLQDYEDGPKKENNSMEPDDDTPTFMDLDQQSACSSDSESKSKKSKASDDSMNAGKINAKSEPDLCDMTSADSNDSQAHRHTDLEELSSVDRDDDGCSINGRLRSSNRFNKHGLSNNKLRCSHCQKVMANKEEMASHIKEHLKTFAMSKSDNASFMKKCISEKLESILLNKALDNYIKSPNEAALRNNLPLKILNQLTIAKKNQFALWKTAIAQMLVDPSATPSTSSETSASAVATNKTTTGKAGTRSTSSRSLKSALMSEIFAVEKGKAGSGESGDKGDGYPCPMCPKTFPFTHLRNSHLIMVHAPRQSTHKHLKDSTSSSVKKKDSTSSKPSMTLCDNNTALPEKATKIIHSYLLNDSVNACVEPKREPRSDTPETRHKTLDLFRKSFNSLVEWKFGKSEEEPSTTAVMPLPPPLSINESQVVELPPPALEPAPINDLPCSLQQSYAERSPPKLEAPAGIPAPRHSSAKPTAVTSKPTAASKRSVKPCRKKISKKEIDLPPAIVKMKAEQALLELSKFQKLSWMNKKTL